MEYDRVTYASVPRVASGIG